MTINLMSHHLLGLSMQSFPSESKRSQWELFPVAAEFCKALQETSVDNLFADVLHFLLKSIFNLQEQEEEEEDWDGPDANSRRQSPPSSG